MFAHALPLLSFLLSNPAPACAGAPRVIALIPPAAYEVLERENQLAQLCPQKESRAREACEQEQRKAKSWALPLRKKPESSAAKVGELRIVATPGQGLVASYVNEKGVSAPLPSDSKNTDWGYGNFFEFTVAGVQGDWIQLPRRPFPEPLWINLKDLGAKDLPEARELATDTVYESSLGDIVPLKFAEKSFSYRPENPNDMACGAEPTPVPAEKLRPITGETAKLFDADGHLTAWPKYPRGC